MTVLQLNVDVHLSFLYKPITAKTVHHLTEIFHKKTEDN